MANGPRRGRVRCSPQPQFSRSCVGTNRTNPRQPAREVAPETSRINACSLFAEFEGAKPHQLQKCRGTDIEVRTDAWRGRLKANHTRTSGTSNLCLRNAASKAFTMRGSKSVPEAFTIVSRASKGERPLR